MMFLVLRTLIYLLTCMYCIADVIPVGSVIKYIGYMETFVENISQVFDGFQDIRANTPFIETYLSFFDIKTICIRGLSPQKNVPTGSIRWNFAMFLSGIPAHRNMPSAICL